MKRPLIHDSWRWTYRDHALFLIAWEKLKRDFIRPRLLKIIKWIDNKLNRIS